MGTERYRSHGPVRLGWLDVPLEDGLAHRQRADIQIEARPQPWQLADSQSRRGDETDHRPIRFVDLLQQLCEAVAGHDRGFLFEPLLRELDAPCKVYLEISVLDSRFENAREQYPRIAHRLPATSLAELLRDPAGWPAVRCHGAASHATSGADAG